MTTPYAIEQRQKAFQARLDRIIKICDDIERLTDRILFELSTSDSPSLSKIQGWTKQIKQIVEKSPE